MVKRLPNFILAADTSTPLGSVAILQQDQKSALPHLISERSWDLQNSHSEIIALEAQELLKENNIGLSDIQIFACGTGPGSFTGIRVALNFIKTLAYTFDKPVLTLNSLQLMALPALQKNQTVFCMQSAFRNLFYVAQYQNISGTISETLGPSAWTLEQFNESKNKFGLVVGEAFRIFEKDISQDQRPNFQRDLRFEDRPRASNFRFHNFLDTPTSEILQWFQLKALYVRASEAEEKLWKGGSISSERERQ